jgi:hypothetical protein
MGDSEKTLACVFLSPEKRSTTIGTESASGEILTWCIVRMNLGRVVFLPSLVRPLTCAVII